MSRHLVHRRDRSSPSAARARTGRDPLTESTVASGCACRLTTRLARRRPRCRALGRAGNCAQVELDRRGAGSRPAAVRIRHTGRGADSTAQPGQLALHAPVSPGRVLPHQPAPPAPAAAPGPAAAGTPDTGGGPPPGHQPPMPAQHRLRRQQHPGTPGPGKAPDQRTDHRPVRPGQLRPSYLPAQHGQLVPRHQNFGILGRPDRASSTSQPTSRHEIR